MFARVVALAILATHVFFLWAVRDRIARGDPDFTVFYTAVNILREGRGAELYNASTQDAVQRQFTANSDIRRGPLPYIHPPFEALVFLPLTFLPYTAAFVVWNLINVGMLSGVWLLLRSSVEVLRRISWGELCYCHWLSSRSLPPSTRVRMQFCCCCFFRLHSAPFTGTPIWLQDAGWDLECSSIT